MLHQVKGQFNLNPSNKLKDQLDSNFEEDRYYVNQLQNHRITDQHITTNPKSSDQLVESNTIRVEDTAIHNSLPDRYTPNAFTNANNYNYNTQPNGLTNAISTTMRSSSSNLMSSGSSIGSSATTIGATNGATNEQYPNSQAITRTQIGRLQSTTPDAQEYPPNTVPGQFNNPNNPNSRYGTMMGYPQPNNHNMMGSPSLISSIFSKFNQPMGTFYPYGNFGNNNYYPGYYGSSYYGSGYPASSFGGYGGGGNFITNAFYAKMRPLMSFFQRLSGKFSNNPYSYGSPYNPYGSVGAYTNGLYNYGGYGGKFPMIFPI